MVMLAMLVVLTNDDITTFVGAMFVGGAQSSNPLSRSSL